jgi:hypothetical protein
LCARREVAHQRRQIYQKDRVSACDPQSRSATTEDSLDLHSYSHCFGVHGDGSYIISFPILRHPIVLLFGSEDTRVFDGDFSNVLLEVSIAFRRVFLENLQSTDGEERGVGKLSAAVRVEAGGVVKWAFVRRVLPLDSG